jgi:hypothetical protein
MRVLSAILVFSLLSCVSPHVQIHRETVPADRPEIDINDKKTGVIRSVDVDISVRYISPEDYRELRNYDQFNLRETHSGNVPPFDIYFITVRNTSAQAVSDVSFQIKGNGTSYPALTLQEIHRKLSTKTYTIGKAQSMFTMRRIVKNETELDRIDFDKDTIIYPFGFILPFESGSVFAAFAMPPVELRRFRLSTNYTIAGMKKNVDFEMVRIEYRQDDPRKGTRER